MEGYIIQGANVTKFYNTPESALTILDNAYRQSWTGNLSASIQTSIDLPLRETPFASHIYDHLQTRIHDLQMQQASIQLELQMAIERSDEKLEALLTRQLEDVRMLFTKFEKELRELGSPADPPVNLEPVAPIYDPAALTPRPLPTPELVASPPAAKSQKLEYSQQQPTH